jgi:dephospho-CoA kinase
VSPTVVDIPLLYETGHEKDFDAVVVAACGPELQLARLIHRDGFSETDARARIAAQMPIEEKVRRANYVVDTSGTVRTTEEQVARVWAALISGKSKVERGK